MVAVICRCRLLWGHRGVHVCVGASVGIGACVCVCALACAVDGSLSGCAVRDDDVHFCAQSNTHETMFTIPLA